VGSSLLRILIAQSPAHYLWAKEHPSEPTPAQRLGTAIHSAILEPADFRQIMIVKPIFSGYTKKGELTTSENCTEVQEKSQAWHLEHHGKMILKQEELDTIDGILRAISAHKQAARLMSEGHAEESLFWKDPESGIELKTRPDFVREGHIVVDVKSCLDASYYAFQKEIVSRGIHIQAAMQLDGCSAVHGGHFDTHITIAVEKEEPFALQCFQMDEHAIQEGRQLYYAALKTLAQCEKSKVFPAYPELTPVSLPSWAIKGDL